MNLNHSLVDIKVLTLSFIDNDALFSVLSVSGKACSVLCITHVFIDHGLFSVLSGVFY